MKKRLRSLLLFGILLSVMLFIPDAVMPIQAEPDATQIIQSTEDISDVSSPVEDQIVIVYKDPDQNNIAELNLTENEIAEATSLSESVDTVTPAEGQDTDDLIAVLEDQENVQSVCRNIELTVDSVSDLPNDPSVLSNPSYYTNSQIDETWDITNPESDSVVVAVIDTGLNPQAADFEGRYYDTIDFYDPDDPQLDLYGHGTNVASLIAAIANNETGMAGSSGLTDVKILPYRVGGTATTGNIDLDSVVAAVQDIIHNHPEVKVVNLSFGVSLTLYERNNIYKGAIDTLQSCMDQLYEHGIITVAAAGNDGNSKYNYPASCEHVISVTSVDANGSCSSFSNYNDAVDLAATGRSVPVTNTNGSYSRGSGTSFSSPIVAGACAFLLSTTGKTTDEVIDAVLSTGNLEDYGEKNNATGNGILQLKDAFEVLAGESDFTVSIDTDAIYCIGDKITVSASSEGNLTYVFKFNGEEIPSIDGTINLTITTSGTQTIEVTGITACGAQQTKSFSISSTAGSEMTVAVPATNIELNKIALSIKKGKAETLIATILPKDADDKTVNWTSSDNNIATVENGKVTAVASGTATITAKTVNGLTASCSVTVTNPAAEIALDKDSISLVKGSEEQLTASVLPADADDQTVNWTSSDETIATVENGKVTAIKSGTATITAETVNGLTASCTVKVTNPAAEITLDKDSISLVKGSEEQLTASVLPLDADDKTVNWASSDETIATVENGKVTAVASGTATITAKTVNGLTASCTVTAVIKGDINQDGTLDIIDARLAKRIAMKELTVTYTEIGFFAGDLDCSGKITINEARKIKRTILGETHL